MDRLINAYEFETAEDIINDFRDKVVYLAGNDNVPCAYFYGKLFYVLDVQGKYEEAIVSGVEVKQSFIDVLFREIMTSGLRNNADNFLNGVVQVRSINIVVEIAANTLRTHDNIFISGKANVANGFIVNGVENVVIYLNTHTELLINDRQNS